MRTQDMRGSSARLCASALVLMTVGLTPVFAQVESTDRLVGDKPETFFADAVCFAASDLSGSRLDLFVQVGYSNLTFVKQGDLYSASYELSLTIIDSSGSLVSEKTWTEEVKNIAFDRSVSTGAYSLTERRFELEPGLYTVTVGLRDGESGSTRKLTKHVLISNYQRFRFAMSDIMLVSRVSVQGGMRSIVPNVSPNLGTLTEPFYAFFETYNSQGVDSVEFAAVVKDRKGDRQLEVDTLERLHAGRNEVLMKIDQRNLPLGDYVLDIRALRPGKSGAADTLLAVTNRPFIMRWRGMPISVKDLDLAIDQIRYIAKDSEIDYIKDGKTTEEKQKRFMEFWKKRSTNPNAQRNIRMEEYYARVDYANKHFAHYIEGWRTDMGMVYIIFGPPNSVDRHPYDMDAKPYEVWSYYELNHQFVFVDETGFGDYRLVTPIWEVWRRPND